MERIFFKRIAPEENVWVLQGEVKFKRAHFLATARTFEAQVDMDTGEVKSYIESRLQNPREQQEK